MKHRLATFCFAFLALALIVAPVSAYWQTRVIYKPTASGGGCAQSAAYIAAANASGGGTVNGTYTAALNTAICATFSTNSTISGTLASRMDALYIVGNQASQYVPFNVANLGTYNATVNGSMSFTANQGYTGTLSPSDFIDSNFNPTTAPSPKYVQNSAHIGVYVRQQGTDTLAVSSNIAGGFYQTNIFTKFADGNAYFRINDNQASPSGGAAVATGIGYYVAVRTGSTAQFGYKDGGVLTTTPATSGGPSICNLIALGQMNDFASCTLSSGATNYQLSLWHFGSQLSATDVANMYAIWVTGFGATVGW